MRKFDQCLLYPSHTGLATALSQHCDKSFIKIAIYSQLFLICQNAVVWLCHNSDVIMGAIASQIISSTVCSGADQRKHQSSVSLAFVWGIHRSPVNSPHKWPVTNKMFQFDDVAMLCWRRRILAILKCSKVATATTLSQCCQCVFSPLLLRIHIHHNAVVLLVFATLTQWFCIFVLQN